MLIEAHGSGLVVQLDWDGAGVDRRAAEKDQDGTLVARGIMNEREATFHFNVYAYC